jgi:ankyrin repeat protein
LNISWQIKPILNCKFYFIQNFCFNDKHFSRRLSAGHTAVHIACRLANIPVLRLLLSIKKDDEDNEEEQQNKEDKHIYDCLRIRDHANLTPIHWAATQESVSKRQKVFAYLDQRMPGVLDSRYNINWFHSWAKTHPWVIKQKSSKTIRTM